MRPSRQWSKTTFNSSRWKPVKRVQHCCQQAACEIWKSVQCTITHSILSFSWQQPRPLQKCAQMRNNVRHSTELVWGRAFYKKTWWHFPDAKSCQMWKIKMEILCLCQGDLLDTSHCFLWWSRSTKSPELSWLGFSTYCTITFSLENYQTHSNN